MLKVIQALPYLTPVKGLMGVEIEVEGVDLPNNHNVSKEFTRYWKITEDGSLRGQESWEYVFNTPLSLQDTEKALNILGEEYHRLGSTVDDTVRAGIHVHINVQDLTLNQLMVFFSIYYSLEEVLIRYCGEGRAGNHFCLRAGDAEYMMYALLNAFQQGRFAELASDNVRYAAMNVNALFKYGSLEFRTLRSTRDINRIFTWVKVINQIKVMSLTFTSAKEVLESMSLNGGEAFAKRILGDELYPLFHCEDLQQLVLCGARHVQDLVYLVDVEGLKEFNIEQTPRPMHKKLLEKAVIERFMGGLLEAPILENVKEDVPPFPGPVQQNFRRPVKGLDHEFVVNIPNHHEMLEALGGAEEDEVNRLGKAVLQVE